MMMIGLIMMRTQLAPFKTLSDEVMDNVMEEEIAKAL